MKFVATTLILISTLLLAVGIMSASADERFAEAAETVVNDTFTDNPGTTLTSHSPEVDVVGGGWKVEFGPNFEIASSGKEVRNTLGLDSPYYAVIDGRLEDTDITVDFTRTGQTSEVGIAFRWKDSSNNYRGVFDGRRGYLIKTIAGVDYLLDSSKVKWPDGTTRQMRVVTNGSSIELFLGGKKAASATDSELRENTNIGLYYMNESSSSIGNFRVRALGDVVTPTTPPVGSLVLQDNFDTGAGSLSGRTVGSETWSDIVGTWEVTAGGQARLLTASGSGDQITAIGTATADADISADVTWVTGVAGLAWSVDASNDRAIVFYEGSNIVAGKIRPSDSAFVEFGRASYSWTSGDTRNMRVRINGSNARVYIDDPADSTDQIQVLVLAIGTGMDTSQRAGLFSKDSSNLFDNFTVRNSPALLQADGTVGVAPPQTLSPPAVPSGAYLYDSFTYYNGDLIENRSPDHDPSGKGWQIQSGKWKFFNFKIGELEEDAGDKFSFIDTGRDEYVITSEQIWDGGRTGITFGGLAPSSRNGFLYFVQSNGDVVLGKKIGGVFFTLGSAQANWKHGGRRTISVRVKGDQIKAYIGKRKVFTITDGDLPGATWAGIFRNGSHEDRFDDFLLHLPAGAPTPTPTPIPTPIVQDVFTGTDGAVIDGRNPDIAPTASLWDESTSRGDWEIASNSAVETGAFDYGISDRRIIIDAGVADHEVSVDITRNGPQWTTHFARNMFPRMGVVTRSTSNDSEYVMWYFDGDSSIVARSQTAELGRISLSWTVGDSFNLAIRVEGDNYQFKVDGVTQLTRTHSTGSSNSYVGLYASEIETGNENVFDNFRVMPIP